MKVKFDYKEWLENQDKKVVDENGDEVYFYEYGDKHVVLLHGKAYNPDDAPIYFDVPDESDETARNTKVSEFAERFQRTMGTYEKQLVVGCSAWFIGLVGVFCRYSFFTKELWRKVDGFEYTDKAEVIAAFLHWWFRYQYGFQNMPIGSCWASEHPSSYTEDDESYERYVKKYMPLYKAYSKWCEQQR